MSVFIILNTVLGISAHGLALPSCPSDRDPVTSPWSECHGTYAYANGKKYVGEWKKGLKHGQGVLKFGQERVQKGTWQEDRFILSKSFHSGIKANVKKLIKINRCLKCNLRGANLRKLNLKGAFLAGSDLTGADLTRTDLTGANFTGAILNQANFTMTNLAKTISLTGTQLVHSHLCRTKTPFGEMNDNCQAEPRIKPKP